MNQNQDIITCVGDIALNASRSGDTVSSWNVFFSKGEPPFSQVQLDQLSILFQQIFPQQNYLDSMNFFISATSLCNEYLSNPSKFQIRDILNTTNNGAIYLLSNGYTTARFYITSALLNILALKFTLDTAQGQEIIATQKKIAQEALDILNNLLQLEQDYGTEMGWKEYADFKQATVLQNGLMSPYAIKAFGEDYIQKVQGLMGLVKLYDPERMKEIIHPPYMMLFVPYDPVSTPNTWSSYSKIYQTTAFIYKCQALPPGVPSNYFPLSDLATISVNESQPNPPQFVIYVAAHAFPLIEPKNFKLIYDDHGSRNLNDYAGYRTIPAGIGSYSASFNTQLPDFSNPTRCIDSSFYVSLKLLFCMWDDRGSGAHMDGAIYLHPQFGEFGIYHIEGSYSTPNPDTINGLSFLAITGHAEYKQNNN